VTSCISDSAAIYIMVVKFRNTICPPPHQLSLHRRAALSSNSNGIAKRALKAVYIVKCLWLLQRGDHVAPWEPETGVRAVPPAGQPYTILKQRLLASYQLTAYQRTEKLFQRPALDRRKPSDSILKGTVQWKLTGVLSGINRKLMICHCSDGYSFFNLKGLRSLKSKNVFSALTGTLF
jgi:hypothetical protein